MGYAEFGDPGGRPVLYFHGYPGSRLEAAFAGPDALVRGVRLIAVDRPGVGLSDYQPRRELLHWPGDVSDLADALSLEKFSVVGISGGGPYAAACAWTIPERLDGAAIVCGLGPIHGPGEAEGVTWFHRVLFGFAHRGAPLLRVSLGALGMFLRRRPDIIFRYLPRYLPEPDRMALKDESFRRALSESLGEAFSQGGRGLAREAWIYARPWGFSLRQISMEVDLWHGEEDSEVPVAMGRFVAAAIPRCRARFLPGEGHLSIIQRHLGDLLDKGTLKR
ncbi:MAG: alpha/beta hydrolase [Planctomycetota bacterium]|nr:alpha/beta hydrolase [Planctomycetota bacterium]